MPCSLATFRPVCSSMIAAQFSSRAKARTSASPLPSGLSKSWAHAGGLYTDFFLAVGLFFSFPSFVELSFGLSDALGQLWNLARSPDKEDYHNESNHDDLPSQQSPQSTLRP